MQTPDLQTAKQYYIFDMDGTIVDLEQLNFDSFKETIQEKLGQSLSYDDYLDLFAGSGSKRGFQRYFEKHKIEKQDVSAFVKHYRGKKREVLENRFWEVVTVKPGLEMYLQELKEAGKRLAVATSTAREFAELILKNANLIQYFDTIVAVEDVKNTKPAPDLFLEALEQLGGKRSQAIVFEDSANGIQAACNAGIDYIVVQNRGKNDSLCDREVMVISDYLRL